MKIKITTESIVDLTQELYDGNDISILPLIVMLGEKEYFDSVNITPDDIYAFVDKTKILPKTAARSPEAYKEFFSGFLSDGYDAVVHLSISSEISASYANAAIAAADMPNVCVYDTRSLSTGSGIQVLYACDLAKEGLAPEEIVNKLTERREKASCSFIADSLNYLHKGGRCSSTQKFLGVMLNIKPTIVMIGGKLIAGKKYLGNLKKVITAYVKDTLGSIQPDLKRIFITFTEIDKDIIDKVETIIRETFSFASVIKTVAGATITSHCGKGTLGVLFYNA